MEIIPTQYELSSVVNDLSNIVKGRAEKKGLKLIVDVNHSVPHLLYGDEVRIKQIAINLLTNSIKYTETGTITLNIDYEKISEEEIDLSFVITDTGAGMKPEDLDKLFSPFTRIEESRHRSVEGTGLGMSIVKQLLDLMGSHLDVKSTYGEGSEFSFSIIQELGKSSESSDSRNDNTAAGDGTGPFTAPDASVLIVDDTPSNIKIMSLLLKNSLINTDGAVNGKTAILLCEKKKYDLIFIDHMMPEMDGIETLRKIRSDPENINSGSVFVMLTANDETGTKEMYIKEGFDDYMSKPINVTELDSILRKYLNK